MRLLLCRPAMLLAGFALFGANPAHAMDHAATGQRATAIEKLLDEQAVERLIVDYSWFLDAKDFENYGAMFSDGSILNSKGKAIATGSAEVGGLAKHYLGGPSDIFVRHLVTNIRINIGDDGKSATAESYLTTIEAPKGKPAYVYRIGRYHDTFRKTNGQWKFASRQEMTDWVLKERQPPPGAVK